MEIDDKSKMKAEDEEQKDVDKASSEGIKISSSGSTTDPLERKQSWWKSVRTPQSLAVPSFSFHSANSRTTDDALTHLQQSFPILRHESREQVKLQNIYSLTYSSYHKVFLLTFYRVYASVGDIAR
jgi:hypothetical protein